MFLHQLQLASSVAWRQALDHSMHGGSWCSQVAKAKWPLQDQVLPWGNRWVLAAVLWAVTKLPFCLPS